MIFFDLRNVHQNTWILSALLSCTILLAGAAVTQAQVIDEGGLTTGQANAGVTNRPMNQSVNLKKVQAAFDQAKPQDNTKVYPWKDNVTYRVRLREFMQTIVVLPMNEKINGQVLGDATNFAMRPLPGTPNRFVVWARDPGADTNLTIFGESGRIYPFYLRVDSVQSPFVPDLLVYIMDDSLPYGLAQTGDPFTAQGTAPIRGKNESAGKDSNCAECNQEEYPPQQFARDYLRELPQTSGKKANYNYVMRKGSRDLAPITIFDDGYFTYFKFGDGNLDSIKVPVIYQVVDGYDSLLNTRVEGGYIVAETINEKFTIRRGDEFLCILNKAYKHTTALKE